MAKIFLPPNKENIESVIGIENSKGKRNTELPGKSFQLIGESSTIKKISSIKINSIIVDKIFSIVLLFFIIIPMFNLL